MNILFLDLEDTIITPVVNGWSCFDIINSHKINSFIQQENITDVRIFSFAIWNEKDVAEFKKWCLPSIEREIGISIDFIPDLDEIVRCCTKQRDLTIGTITPQDVRDFYGKDLSFVLCVNEWLGKKSGKDIEEINQHKIFLLDDMVDDFRIHKGELEINVLNVDKLVLKNEIRKTYKLN